MYFIPGTAAWNCISYLELEIGVIYYTWNRSLELYTIPGIPSNILHIRKRNLELYIKPWTWDLIPGTHSIVFHTLNSSFELYIIPGTGAWSYILYLEQEPGVIYYTWNRSLELYTILEQKPGIVYHTWNRSLEDSRFWYHCISYNYKTISIICPILPTSRFRSFRYNTSFKRIPIIVNENVQ